MSDSGKLANITGCSNVAIGEVRLVVLLDIREFVDVIDHHAERALIAGIGRISPEVDAVEVGAVTQMESSDRVQRQTVALLVDEIVRAQSLAGVPSLIIGRSVFFE